MNMSGCLYLIPTNLSDAFRPQAILPQEVIATAQRLNFYVAENAKTARAFLKVLDAPAPPNARLKQLMASKSPWEK